MRTTTTLLASLAWLSPALALNKFGVLEVVKQFAEDIVAAGRGDVPSYDAGIFTADVKGEIDVFGKLNGREAATDFIFSTFSAFNANPEGFSPVGRPTFYNVSAISVQHDIASLSIIFDLEYPMLQKTWPFQIDGWFRINNDREIEAFDLTFRHFSWLMEQVMAEVDPRLSAMLGTSAANMTSGERLSAALVQQICSTTVQGCTGSDSQFTDVPACVSALGSKKLGEWYQLRDDSLLCRAVQAPLIAMSAERYCPVIAPDSSVCTPQDYSTSINETAPKGWLAAKYVTPQNAKYVEHIYAVAGQPLDPLIEVELAQETLHSWEPSLYATSTFGYFLFFYAFAHATFFLFQRYSTCFVELNEEHQRNVVMYAMTIIFTTIALARQLSPIRWAFGYYALWQIHTMRTAAVLISALYIFELVFRFNMRSPLVAHHFFTILAISLSVTLVEYTQSPTYVVSSIIWMLQATTEQPTFIGLLGYRMHWRRQTVATILKVAAIQTFLVKTASAVGVFVYWAMNQRYTYQAIDYVWSASVVIIVVGLMATQVWGSYITYMIGVRVGRKDRFLDRSLPAEDSTDDHEKQPRSASTSRPTSGTVLIKTPGDHSSMAQGSDEHGSQSATSSPPFSSPVQKDDDGNAIVDQALHVPSLSYSGQDGASAMTATAEHYEESNDGYRREQRDRPYGGV